jgi:DNA-binding response OmpR family regulator
MSATLAPPQCERTPLGAGNLLPTEIRLLFVSESYRNGSWLASALAADGACSVQLDEAQDRSDGLERLRQTAYDAVLISHEPPQLDALEWLESMQAGGLETPAVILGTAREADLAPLCYEAGAEAYISLHSATTRVLIWTVARARQRHRLWLENRRWRQADAQRQEIEQQEFVKLLQERQARTESGAIPAAKTGSIDTQPATQNPNRAAIHPLSTGLGQAYGNLLRACAMSDVARHSADLLAFAEQCSQARVAPVDLLHLHQQQLGELVQHLGTRGTRHVLQRGDQLISMLLAQVAQAYRDQFERLMHPPRQLWLQELDAER